MFNVVSVLSGKVYIGDVFVKDVGLYGMIILCGDFMDENVGVVVQYFVGVDLLDVLQVLVGEDGCVVLWMLLDELLLLVFYEQVVIFVIEVMQVFGDMYVLVVNVLDVCVVFELFGFFVVEVLVKVVLIDMVLFVFMLGMVCWICIVQVFVVFWISGEDIFIIVCFCLVVDYVFEVLEILVKVGVVGVLK